MSSIRQTQIPNGAHTWLVLWKAARAMEAHAVRSVEEAGLCISDFSVLEALLHKGPLPVNVIGKKVLLTSGSITVAVDRLAKRGLVERTDDPDDRRVRVVQLTPTGRTLATRAFARHTVDLDHVTSVLTPRERTTLIALLRKLGMAADGSCHSFNEEPHVYTTR